MDTPRHRRQFLALAGTGVTASFAGCSALNSQSDTNESEDDDESANESDDSDPLAGLSDAATTAVVGPDRAAQQELQALEQELAEEVEDGETSEEEMRAQLQERQQEALTAATDALESYVEEAEDLTIEDELPDQGAFLIDGSASAMIDALNEGAVAQLYPGQAFVTTQQQIALQEEAAQMQTEENESSDGDDESSDDSE